MPMMQAGRVRRMAAHQLPDHRALVPGKKDYIKQHSADLFLFLDSGDRPTSNPTELQVQTLPPAPPTTLGRHLFHSLHYR